MRWLVVAVVVSCTPRHADLPSNDPGAGISIALYASQAGEAYGVVDDRRWIELAGKELVVERVEPGADLASLVIEPLDGAAIHVGQCSRSQLPVVAQIAEPSASEDDDASRHAESVAHFDVTVRCAVDARPGRHLIRVLYAASTLRYRAQHDIDVVTPGRATLTTRFAVTTPVWHERAQLTIFDGLPGGDQSPHEVARGTALLDGSIAVISVPTRQLPAQLRWIYDVPTPEAAAAADPSWNAQSIQLVWLWLELPDLRLAPGSVRVHVELPDVFGDGDVAQTARRQTDRPGAPLRLPLWTDATLRGMHQRFDDVGASGQLDERVMCSVANLGEVAREVWVEEHARPAHTRRLERAWPTKPELAGDVVRSKLEIRPHRIERVGYTIAYDF